MPRVSAAHERQVRDRIVSAALRVFAERGLHRATMQDVVREAGLSVGAIYTYFRSKGELFLAGCDMTAEQELGELGRRLARANSVVERLAVAIGFFFDAMEAPTDHADSAAFLVQAWAEADQEPAIRDMLLRRREQLVTISRMLIQEGIASGEIPAWLDVEAAATATSALLDGLLLQRLEAGPHYRRADFERRAFVIAEALIAAATGRRPEIPAAPPIPYRIAPVPPGSERAVS